MRKRTLFSLMLVLVIVSTLIAFTGCGKKQSEIINNNGTEQKENLQKLSEVVELGDVVAYNPKTEQEHTYEHQNIGQQNMVFSSNDNIEWRVLNIDKNNGNIELFGVTPDLAQMSSIYAKESLNKIASVYGYGDGAESARSISLKDIKKYAKYDENEDTICKISVNYKYGQTNTYNLTSIITYPVEDTNGVITDVLKSGNQLVQQDFYVIDDLSEYIDNEKVSSMLTTSRYGYWLADTCYNLRDEGFSILCRCITKKGMLGGGIVQFDDGKWHNHQNNSVGVIVKLKSNVKTTGKDENGIWQLEIK